MLPAFSAELDDHFSKNDDIWHTVRKDFNIPSSPLILNNGAVSQQPIIVQDYIKRKLDIANQGPSYFINRVLGRELSNARWELAQFLGVKNEEIAINRNATEGLETIIFGFPLKSGDEVVMCNLDYPPMRFAFLQRAKREGIIVKEVQMNHHIHDDEQIIELYKAQINNKTKLVLITQVLHYHGQIMPVKAIAKEAKNYGADVLVDGAHAIAQMPVSIQDLNVDYYAASLHKWLCGPLGTGVLFVKEDKISKIWPLFSAVEPESECIEKFYHLGTQSIPNQLGITAAMHYHNKVGTENKINRFKDLKNYWVNKAMQLIPGINLTIPIDQTNGIVHFNIEDVAPSKIYADLLHQHKIYTMYYTFEDMFKGVRVTPNIFTSYDELERFVEALLEISKKSR